MQLRVRRSDGADEGGDHALPCAKVYPLIIELDFPPMADITYKIEFRLRGFEEWDVATVLGEFDVPEEADAQLMKTDTLMGGQVELRVAAFVAA